MLDGIARLALHLAPLDLTQQHPLHALHVLQQRDPNERLLALAGGIPPAAPRRVRVIVWPHALGSRVRVLERPAPGHNCLLLTLVRLRQRAVHELQPLQVRQAVQQAREVPPADFRRGHGQRADLDAARARPAVDAPRRRRRRARGGAGAGGGAVAAVDGAVQDGRLPVKGERAGPLAKLGPLVAADVHGVLRGLPWTHDDAPAGVVVLVPGPVVYLQRHAAATSAVLGGRSPSKSHGASFPADEHVRQVDGHVWVDNILLVQLIISFHHWRGRGAVACRDVWLPFPVAEEVDGIALGVGERVLPDLQSELTGELVEEGE